MQSFDTEKKFSIEISTINSNGVTIQLNKLPSTAYFECGYRCQTCEKENINLCLSCAEEYPIFDVVTKECHKRCPDENYYIKLDEEGNKICDLCSTKCRSCEGSEDYCISCEEPYFLENNTCVLNCSEGYKEDEEGRACYLINYVNISDIIEKIVYVNVSVPEPYPVFIERNFCLSYNNETQTEDIFRNLSEIIEKNEKNVEFTRSKEKNLK